MKNQSIQEKLSEISSYSQVNKPFLHAYGTPAAVVLSILLYKYDFWNKEGRLEEIKTKKGNILYKFYISRIDLAFESGISFSMLEKMNESNPLIILENLGFIKRLKRSKINNADYYVLYPSRIISEITKLTKLYNEDRELIKNLSSSNKIKFYKALRGKKTRAEVYNNFEYLDNDEELEIEDCEIKYPSVEEFLASEGESTCTLEGIIKKNSKSDIISKKKTNPLQISEKVEKESTYDFCNNNYNERFKDKDITIELVGQGISAYMNAQISTLHIHEILKNYIPEGKGSHWKMSDQDRGYIFHNLSEVEPEYLDAVLLEIEKNVGEMINDKRKMRFGSMLAKIYERLITSDKGRKEN